MVIYLKNVIARQWNKRKSKGVPLYDDELKQFIKTWVISMINSEVDIKLRQEYICCAIQICQIDFN